MKRFFGACVMIAVLVSCHTEERPEQLAKQYCGSCHLFPSPDLLDKKTWTGPVMRQMAFRMGLPRLSEVTQIPLTDLPIVQTILPTSPMISEEDLKLISEYYRTNAPDSLTMEVLHLTERVNHFIPLQIPFKHRSVTLLKFDTSAQRLYAGTRSSELISFASDFSVEDSIILGSEPSDIRFLQDGYLVTEMGIMDPNDQEKGNLVYINTGFERRDLLIDSLKRPVFFERGDLDADGLQDFVLCNYGNFTGELVVHFGTAKAYEKVVLLSTPGSRKIVFRDFDQDGLTDILALITQGDEKLSIFYNKGNRSFTEKVIARFPPVYGCNYFELADFNSDGSPDILLTNGDNADYSTIVKPYHAVRILENDGNNEFEEVWSFAMPGASQASAHDFDGDGDPDIAAISFFPDEVTRPEQGFIYFQNEGSYEFKPLIIEESKKGRWLVMECADFDRDADIDIVLGAFDLQGGAGALGLAERPSREEISILLFRNTSAD